MTQPNQNDRQALPAGTSRDPIQVRGMGPQDAVATVWYQLGYRPTESLVLVGIAGPRRRLSTIARGDLPPDLRDVDDGRSTTTLRAIVTALYEPVAGQGERDVLALVFSDRLFGGSPVSGSPDAGSFDAAGPTGTGQRISELIHSAVRSHGGRAVDVIGVTSRLYRSLECPSAGCCPPGGRPLAEVESSRAAVAHILVGAEVAAGEAELLRDVWPVAAEASAGLSDRSSARSVELSRPAGLPALAPGNRRLQWLVWERAFGAGEIASGRAASLAPYLADPHLRDAVLVAALGADREVVLGRLAEADREHAQDLHEVCRRNADEPEQAARLERARAVLATAARCAVAGERGGALAVLAALAWYQGKAARARLLVQAAMADQPGHSLARLIDDLLLAAVPPPWLQGSARARDGARDDALDTQAKYL